MNNSLAHDRSEGTSVLPGNGQPGSGDRLASDALNHGAASGPVLSERAPAVRVQLPRTEVDEYERAMVLWFAARDSAGRAFDHFCEWFRFALVYYPLELGHRIDMGAADTDADRALALLQMHSEIRDWSISWKREVES